MTVHLHVTMAYTCTEHVTATCSLGTHVHVCRLTSVVTLPDASAGLEEGELKVGGMELNKPGDAFVLLQVFAG